MQLRCSIVPRYVFEKSWELSRHFSANLKWQDFPSAAPERLVLPYKVTCWSCTGYHHDDLQFAWSVNSLILCGTKDLGDEIPLPDETGARVLLNIPQASQLLALHAAGYAAQRQHDSDLQTYSLSPT
jgi:hypothetical protein